MEERREQKTENNDRADTGMDPRASAVWLSVVLSSIALSGGREREGEGGANDAMRHAAAIPISIPFPVFVLWCQVVEGEVESTSKGFGLRLTWVQSRSGKVR